MRSMDRRLFLTRLGTGAAAAAILPGCLSLDDSSSREDALDSVAPGFPADRDDIEWFCSQFSPRTITQFGYVVPGTEPTDLDRSIAGWGRDHGVGPFCLLRPAPRARAFQRSQHFAITPAGRQADFSDATNPDVELALAQVEDHAQVELILQRDLDLSTVYRAVYPGVDQGGFHHACIVSTDLALDLRALRAMGIAEGLQLDTLFTGAIGKVLYLDTRELAQLGCHFEITQDTALLPAIGALYAAIHHMGTTLGPFGDRMGSTSPAALLVDRERLARTNILFEAGTFTELATRALLLATKTGWRP
jgi:hypothetical protein